MPSLTTLSSSPWTTLILGLVSIAGVVLTIVFYLKSHRFKMPVFRTANMPVIGDKTQGIDGLSVSYNGVEVTTFSVTRFAIWNAGNEVIDATDVAPSDPLRIEATGRTQILWARISYIKKEANNFRVSVDEAKKHASLGFDYFHRSEGVVVEVYHTGESQDDLMIAGTIKGIDRFTNVQSLERKYVFGWFDVLHGLFKWVRNETAKMWIVVTLALITLPIYLVLKLADGFRQIAYRPPKEYDLRG